MKSAHRRALSENTSSEWEYLNLQPLLFPLKVRGVLTHNEYNRLISMRHEPDKQKTYLNYLLTRKPDSAFDVLLSVLEKQGPQFYQLRLKIKDNRK